MNDNDNSKELDTLNISSVDKSSDQSNNKKPNKKYKNKAPIYHKDSLPDKTIPDDALILDFGDDFEGKINHLVNTTDITRQQATDVLKQNQRDYSPSYTQVKTIQKICLQTSLTFDDVYKVFYDSNKNESETLDKIKEVNQQKESLINELKSIELQVNESKIKESKSLFKKRTKTLKNIEEHSLKSSDVSFSIAYYIYEYNSEKSLNEESFKNDLANVLSFQKQKDLTVNQSFEILTRTSFDLEKANNEYEKFQFLYEQFNCSFNEAYEALSKSSWVKEKAFSYLLNKQNRNKDIQWLQSQTNLSKETCEAAYQKSKYKTDKALAILQVEVEKQKKINQANQIQQPNYPINPNMGYVNPYSNQTAVVKKAKVTDSWAHTFRMMNKKPMSYVLWFFGIALIIGGLVLYSLICANIFLVASDAYVDYNIIWGGYVLVLAGVLCLETKNRMIGNFKKMRHHQINSFRILFRLFLNKVFYTAGILAMVFGALIAIEYAYINFTYTYSSLSNSMWIGGLIAIVAGAIGLAIANGFN